jgi:hypothetical protein
MNLEEAAKLSHPDWQQRAAELKKLPKPGFSLAASLSMLSKVAPLKTSALSTAVSSISAQRELGPILKRPSPSPKHPSSRGSGRVWRREAAWQ